MNVQTGDCDDYLNIHMNHHDVTNDDQSFESQTIDLNQLLTSSLVNSNDQQLDDHTHQILSKMSHENEQQHQEQLTHEPPQSSMSLSSTTSSSSSSSSTSSLSSPFSSIQTIEQASPNQNNTINNDNNHLHVPRTKLFVGRLPENCASNHLEELFSQYGQVTECDVVGRYGFVHMSKPEEAEECVKKLNRYSFMGSLLTVEFSTSKVHPEPGTLGRAKGVSRMTKGIRPRIHNHTPYHRDQSCISHRPGFCPSHALHPHATTIPTPPLPPPGRIYGGYSSPYYQDSCRHYERDIYYEADYYGRERHYPPPHDHRPPPPPPPPPNGGAPAPNYEFDSRTCSPPPPPPTSSLPPPPTHVPPPPPPYPVYPSHRNIPIRAYERPVIDEPIPMYCSRGLSMAPHKCHYHKCHYNMHVSNHI